MLLQDSNYELNLVLHSSIFFVETLMVTLRLLENHTIVEFDKVTLSCDVEPKTVEVYRRRWFQDVSETNTSRIITANVIILS